jgi:tRNA A-37 threonylcarbamoyl transferase component Bud32
MNNIVHGKSSIITRDKTSISKQYCNRIDYRREVDGIELMQKAQVTSIVKVLNIDDENMNIGYKLLYPLISLDRENILHAILLLGSIILDEIHAKGIVHGDFWLGNLVVDDEGKLFMIDFEETHKLRNDVDAFNDILAFLDDLKSSFPTEKHLLDSIIENISVTIKTSYMFLGKERLRSHKEPVSGLIANFRSFVELSLSY